MKSGPGEDERKEVDNMSTPTFEIGVVYRKGSRLYLAVSERDLITFRRGRLVEVKPYQKYEVVRAISVEELCSRWGITIERLDMETARFLAPSPAGIKPRPRGSRRQRVADEFAWKTLRLIRIAG
jgi:hypothetical protein